MASETSSEMQGERAPTTTPAMDSNGHAGAPAGVGAKEKLHGRAFYESIGSPRIVLAPMVEQSEFVRNCPLHRGAPAWLTVCSPWTGLATAHPLLPAALAAG